MKQRPAVLLSVALTGIAAGFFYARRRKRESTALLHDIQRGVDQAAARSAATYNLLKKQRRVLRALTDYILPVPKGVEKPAS